MSPRSRHRPSGHRKKQTNAPTPSIDLKAPEKKKGNRLKRFFKSTLGIVSIVSVFLGLSGYFTFQDEIHKRFSSPEQLYEEENFIKGIFIPDQLTSSDTTITIRYASVAVTYNRKAFKEGVDFQPNLIGCYDDISPFNLKMLIKQNRLYISTTFKDIQKLEVVGVIDYQNWKLFKPNLLLFRATDESLEVKDRGGYVIFNMQYQFPSTILLHGYSIGQHCFFVINDGIHLENIFFKDSAIKDIEKIQPIFKY